VWLDTTLPPPFEQEYAAFADAYAAAASSLVERDAAMRACVARHLGTRRNLES
jgi:hypothetical protein